MQQHLKVGQVTSTIWYISVFINDQRSYTCFSRVFLTRFQVNVVVGDVKEVESICLCVAIAGWHRESVCFYATSVSHHQVALAIDGQSLRHVNVICFGDGETAELSVTSQHVDSLVVVVSDEYVAVHVSTHPTRNVELVECLSPCAIFIEQAALTVKYSDAMAVKI